MSRSLSTLLALACVAALTLATPAQAEVKADSGNFEAVVGWYWPENEGLMSDPDSGFSYGLRGGYNWTSHFGIQLGLRGTDLDYELIAPLTGAADISSFQTDLSFLWHFNPDGRAVFHAFGGPGYSWTNIEVPTVLDPDLDDDDNVFTMHLGIGTDIGIGDRFYLRPDVQLKWFTEDEGDANGPAAGTDGDGHTDIEFTFAFGWRFGG